MPAKYGRWVVRPTNAKKLWERHSKGQGFGSLYGGNQVSDVTKDLNEKTISESRQSDFPN